MNSDQITTTVNHTATALLAILAAFGVVDSATSSQLVTLIGQALTEILALVSTVGTLVSIGLAIWRRNHPAQSQAAARSIDADPNNPQVTGPVARALQDAGVTVTPTAITQT